jgi:hypothetical protein
MEESGWESDAGMVCTVLATELLNALDPLLEANEVI